MLPYEILPGFDMYTLMLCVSAVAAILSFRFMSDKMNISGNLQNLCLFNGVLAIVVGYYSAMLFQGFYNIQRYGEFKLRGATFYGGFIGGAVCFIAVYFIVGRFMFKKDREHLEKFWIITDALSASVAIGHAFGRIGCLFAGCCHGAATDAWYGIYMQSLKRKVIPTQLFEAIFLFVLFFVFLMRIKKGKSYNLPIYLGVYGIWRFFLEYFRDDYRGTTVVDFLTPSQLIAVIMVVLAVALFFVQMKTMKKSSAEVSAEPDGEVENVTDGEEAEKEKDAEELDIEDDDD